MKTNIKMKTNINIPIKIIETINDNITKSFDDITPKQKSKLLKTSTTLYMYIYFENIQDYEKGFYTNIHRSDIENVTGKPIINKQRLYYKDILNLLNGVIEINEKYSSGAFAKSYRISKSILSGYGLTNIDLDITKLFKNYRGKKYWKNKYNEHHNQIDKMYNTEIQLGKSIQFMYEYEGMSLKDKMVKRKISGGYTKTINETGRILDSEKILSYTAKVLKFYFSNRWVNISDEGRMYSSLTNLPSILRPFLRVDGKRVEELDVTSSQIVLLSTIIDHKDFSDDVERGIIYEIMGNGNRTEGKYIMFSKILFNKNKIKKHSKYYNLIEKNYPGLTELINDEKEKYNGELWKKLQIMESEIFVNILGNETKIQGTIHDSVLVYKEDRRSIRKYIESIYMEMFNIRVNLK